MFFVRVYHFRCKDTAFYFKVLLITEAICCYCRVFTKHTMWMHQKWMNPQQFPSTLSTKLSFFNFGIRFSEAEGFTIHSLTGPIPAPVFH